MKQIVVIGGGISGLSTSLFLAARLSKQLTPRLHPKPKITLVEGSKYLGGWIQTVDERNSGLALLENGTRTLSLKPSNKHAFMDLVRVKISFLTLTNNVYLLIFR